MPILSSIFSLNHLMHCITDSLFWSHWSILSAWKYWKWCLLNLQCTWWPWPGASLPKTCSKLQFGLKLTDWRPVPVRRHFLSLPESWARHDNRRRFRWLRPPRFRKRGVCSFPLWCQSSNHRVWYFRRRRPSKGRARRTRKTTRTGSSSWVFFFCSHQLFTSVLKGPLTGSLSDPFEWSTRRETSFSWHWLCLRCPCSRHRAPWVCRSKWAYPTLSSPCYPSSI